MTELESIISATCITSVVKVEDLTDGFTLDGAHFRLFLVPTSESDVKVGDVVVVNGCLLPYGEGESLKVPVVVGSWSPVLFKAIEASAIKLEDVDVYAAPIKNYKQ